MAYQREYPTRIRIAVVGIGSHTYRNLLPALHHLPVEVVAFCDVNQALVEKTALEYGCRAYTSTQAMYGSEKLEAVLISVSPQLHPTLACEAFDAGLHVWMEKPPAMRTSEVDTLLAHRKDRVAVVGFKKIFMPGAAKAKEVITSAKYGHPISLLAVYPMTIPENGAKILEDRTFTNWLGNSCHPLSLMLHLGGPVGAVTTYRNRTAGGEGGMVVLEFANGTLGNFHFASGPHPSERYSVFGPHWNLHIDNCMKVSLQRGIPSVYGKTTSYIPEGDDTGSVVWEPQNSVATLENMALFTQGMFFELKHFCDAILSGQPATLGTLEFARQVMQVYEAALISTGERIVL